MVYFLMNIREYMCGFHGEKTWCQVNFITTSFYCLHVIWVDRWILYAIIHSIVHNFIRKRMQVSWLFGMIRGSLHAYVEIPPIEKKYHLVYFQSIWTCLILDPIRAQLPVTSYVYRIFQNHLVNDYLLPHPSILHSFCITGCSFPCELHHKPKLYQSLIDLILL